MASGWKLKRLKPDGVSPEGFGSVCEFWMAGSLSFSMANSMMSGESPTLEVSGLPVYETGVSLDA
jgi:hypothetical protein